MPAWSGFYAVTGGAAASLIGLLFVTVSLNAAALDRGREGSHRPAQQAFENFLVVLILSLIALVPDLGPKAFGRLGLLATATWGAWVLVRLWQAAREPSAHETRAQALGRHLSTLAGFALAVYAAARLALGDASVADLLAAAVIILLVSATEKAWGLLERVARSKRAADASDPPAR